MQEHEGKFEYWKAKNGKFEYWKAKNGKFEYWKAKNGKYYWHLVATNGRILCHSQDYVKAENALKGIDAAIVAASHENIVKLKAPPKRK